MQVMVTVVGNPPLSGVSSQVVELDSVELRELEERVTKHNQQAGQREVRYEILVLNY